MPDRPIDPRQRRSPPLIRRPRVPAGQRLVRDRGWLTTDHSESWWYRVVGHSPDWRHVQLQVAAQPDPTAPRIDVVVQPNGFVVPQGSAAPPGTAAIRIIATAIRAGQRSDDG